MQHKSKIQVYLTLKTMSKKKNKPQKPMVPELKDKFKTIIKKLAHHIKIKIKIVQDSGISL